MTKTVVIQSNSLNILPQRVRRQQCVTTLKPIIHIVTLQSYHKVILQKTFVLNSCFDHEMVTNVVCSDVSSNRVPYLVAGFKCQINIKPNDF